MRIKYELILNLYKNDRIVLAEYVIDFCPTVGSIINIDGNPFIVFSVDSALWEYSGKTRVNRYVRVFKAGCFELNIGDKKY